MTLVVLHVPKTAGSSLTASLRLKYGRDNVLRVANSAEVEAYNQLTQRERQAFSACIAHRPLFLLEAEFPGARIVSMLREPIERQISLYKHAQRNRGHSMHELAKLGGDAWLQANAADPNLAWTNSVARWFWKSSEHIGDTSELMRRLSFFRTEDVNILMKRLNLPITSPLNVSPDSQSEQWSKQQIQRAKEIWQYDINMYRSILADAQS